MESLQHSQLQRLMERLADGDRAAFHPVFERLWPLLRRFAARHLRPEEAEDAAQEALLRIFRRAAEFDRSRSALVWALGIAAFEVRTARRRRQRRREVAPAGDANAEEAWGGAAGPAGRAGAPASGLSPNPEEEAMQAEMEAMVRDALGALRPEDAETLRLYARGERAAVAASAFRKRVERALGRLRAVWRTTDGPS